MTTTEQRQRIKEIGGEPYKLLLERERLQRRGRKIADDNKGPWKTYVVARARRRGRKARLESTITPADIYWPTHCPVLGIKLYYPKQNGEGTDCHRPDLPSLDRWDNSKGYIPGNVFVISWRANVLKSNATADELRKVAAYAEWHPSSLFGQRPCPAPAVATGERFCGCCVGSCCCK